MPKVRQNQTFVQFSDSPDVDAFSRLQVSHPTTVFDVKYLMDNQPTVFSMRSSGTASSTFLSASNSVVMSASSPGSYVVRQSFRRPRYEPAKSQSTVMSLYSLHPQAGCVKRAGAFSSDFSAPYTSGIDGIFIEASGSSIDFCLATTGSINRVSQSMWQNDTMDGHGPSAILIDFTKTHILKFDYQWLGAGRVRCIFGVNGVWYSAHEFNNSNAITGAYMRADQPLRYEIRSDGLSSGTLGCVCASMISDGSDRVSPSEVMHCRDTGAVAIAIPHQVASQFLINAVRLRSSTVFQSSAAKFRLYAVRLVGDDSFMWRLILNPTISGAVSWATTNEMYTQTHTASPGDVLHTVTGGSVLSSGFGSATTPVNVNFDDELVTLGVDLDGVSDVLCVVVSPISKAMSLWSSISWSEL